ncbi:MAG: PaaI family thioesterase [Clostridiales Family XIII bacterium]|jgi:uncharacterized protein (TIGR00369 family)|nr:PaaI family thioesterase [Clostridiales Family XIII bacterium]
MGKLREGMVPETLMALGRGFFPEAIGVEITGVEEGRIDARMVVRPDHLAPNGFLHAAVVIAIADTACGYGAIAHLPEGARGFTTLELKTNHLGTVLDGVITCEATALHMGRSTQVWDAVVREEKSGKSLALFRCTQMVLWER